VPLAGKLKHKLRMKTLKIDVHSIHNKENVYDSRNRPDSSNPEDSTIKANGTLGFPRSSLKSQSQHHAHSELIEGEGEKALSDQG
jgi:hypothetical protein